MLDPRIYRACLVLAALGLVVLAFSLANQPAGSRATLAPEAFNGRAAYATMRTLYASYRSRPVGSRADDQLARRIATDLRSPELGFSVDTDRFTAATVRGARTVTNVVATRAGTESGSIVIVAPRDGSAAQGPAGLSGTATLLELSQDLAGETLNHTVVLASVSASTGTAGLIHLIGTVQGPIDAVLVLSDLASSTRTQPIVIPWSTTDRQAPPALVNTVSRELSSQHAAHAVPPGTGAQLAHLAFGMTISGQAPFARAGIPAVAVSMSGERGPQAGAPLGSERGLNKVGRAMLGTVSALDSVPSLARPSSFVLFDGKVVPGWAISLFVLSLILPVLLTTIDGCARAARRGYPLGRSLIAVLAAAVPFVAAVLVVLVGRMTGLIGAAPPGPSPAGSVALGRGPIAVMIAAAVVALAMVALAQLPFRALERLPAARQSRDSRARVTDRTGDGTAAMMLAVLCVVTLVIWSSNPYAAALLVPALHLWLWAVDSDVAVPLPARLGMVALGAVPVALLVAYFAHTLGFDPVGLVWAATLMVAGHGVALGTVVLWCLALGCMATAVTVIVQAARRPAPAVSKPASVRGPLGYALQETKTARR